jgi:hypothetical protein
VSGSQDGHHSVVALLLKAALIQVSDYRLLGASGFITYNKMKKYIFLIELLVPDKMVFM